MSRSYRGIIIAAVGGIVAVVLATSGYQILNEAEEQPYPAYNYQPARDHLPWTAPKYAPVTAIPYEPHCDDPKEREDADLCAQWASVQAVEESNRLARISMRITALEFGALIVSLIFTGWAAMAAAKAAHLAEETTKGADRAIAEAARGADAMGYAAKAMRRVAIVGGQQLEHSEESTRQQLRAYVSVNPDGINRADSGEAIAHIIVKNWGKIAAKSVEVYVQSIISMDKDSQYFTVPDRSNMVSRVVQPADEMRQGTQEIFAVADIDNVEVFIFVWGVVYYEDGFGQKRFTRFCHRYPGARVRRRPIDFNATGMARMMGEVYEERLIDPKDARHHQYGNDAD